MSKKCRAKCYAKRQNLWLRGNIFYYSVELPRQNGKRRYLRKSLWTDNYYEAREIVRNMTATGRPPLAEFKRIVPMQQAKPAVQPRKISEVLESVILKVNNAPEETVRRKNVITKLLNEVGLTLDNDYSEFHDIGIIENISRNLIKRTDLKGDAKIRHMRVVVELVKCAANIDPDNYKLNVIANLPKIEKTRKADKNPHKPYTEAQLLEIFDPRHKLFHKEPDVFFACLIAMFTGARLNSAITLQYDDIIEKDGIPCIQFIENHSIKHLKNEASERIVPINPQLIDVGFLDYVKRNQTKRKAMGKDFIFPKCQTKVKKYNKKFPRTLFNFLTDIGIKSATGDRLDFHSFRNNASVGMQEAGILGTYINDIIGWEGKNTMEQSYSKHTLGQIKAQVDRFSYGFLTPNFVKWKGIMDKK